MKDLLIHFVNEISSRNFYLNLLAFRLMIHFQIITIVKCEKRNNFILSFSFALYPNIMCNVFRFSMRGQTGDSYHYCYFAKEK